MTENVHYGPDNPYPFSQMKTGCLLDDKTWNDIPVIAGAYGVKENMLRNMNKSQFKFWSGPYKWADT